MDLNRLFLPMFSIQMLKVTFILQLWEGSVRTSEQLVTDLSSI